MVSASTGLPSGIDMGQGSITVMPSVAHSGILRVAANVASAETVVIGSDTYRVATVNTAHAQTSLDLNNTREYVQNVRLTAHGLAIGSLLRCQSEIMAVTGVPDVNHVHLRRGVSGTTIATHADATALFTEAAPTTGGTTVIRVGNDGTLTPTVFTTALTADINSRGSSNVLAVRLDANTIVVAVANKAGGTPVAGGVQYTTTETLAGAGNAWDAATLGGGAPPAHNTIVSRVPIAAEVTAGSMVFVFPFVPTVLDVKVYTTATRAVVAWDGGATVTGTRVVLDNAGVTDWATTNTVILMVRG